MLDTSFYFHFCVKTQKSLLFFLIGVFSDKLCRNEKKYVRTVGCSMQISENLPFEEHCVLIHFWQERFTGFDRKSLSMSM